MAISGTTKTSQKTASVGSHTHKELEAEIAKLKTEIAELSKKCASCCAKVEALSTQGGSSDESLVTRHEWAAWKRKVAKACGIRL